MFYFSSVLEAHKQDEEKSETLKQEKFQPPPPPMSNDVRAMQMSPGETMRLCALFVNNLPKLIGQVNDDWIPLESKPPIFGTLVRPLIF